MKSCDKWSPIIAMVAIDFGFAIVNLLLKRIVDSGMDHLVFITYRQCIATILLAPIAYLSERNRRPKLTFVILCHLFLSAIVGASLTQYFFLLGIQYTSATFSCAFINMVPVITFLMALPFRLENVNIKGSTGGRAKAVGALVCLGGAMILTLYKGSPLFNYSRPGPATHIVDQALKLSSGKRKERWTLGSMAMISGTLLWSSWFLLQSYITKSYPCQYSSTAIMSLFAAIQSAALAVSMDRNFSMWALKGKEEILTVMYAGIVGSGMCYVGMSWCVKKRGPLFTAAFSPLIQIIAAMLDIPFLHEQLHLGSLLGSITVIAGLYILLWGKNKEMQNCVAKVSQGTEEIKDQEPSSQVDIL
ncbi:WAT1-related protein At3g30340 [Rhododendron vialii]|uniref:WAT1-related protein At3g30340 n=1 Tax=Rhododendron vialii TaxID=182163 RepID=UPI00265E1A6A|nr:WAT1-related protein At3g30340 [Rhododendron vialii]